MKTKIRTLNTFIVPVFVFLFFICLYGECMADPSRDTFQIIARQIIDYNKDQAKTLTDPDAYRGEEGALRIRPDAAERLGLKVYIDQYYKDSVELYKEADDALSEAEEVMSYSGKREAERAIIKKILDKFLAYREKSRVAKEKLHKYKENINKEIDDRFNIEICNKTIISLLKQSLRKTDNNLRDALGYFYKRCQGGNRNKDHITSENVRFVNHVFNGFIADASPSQVSLFDLDRNSRNGNSSNSGDWKAVVKKELPELLPYLESAVKKTGESIYRTDPLLFISLMKRESAFNPRAVSCVGAAGLTQIMPQTARGLGLKNVYIPKYYYTAGEYLKKERNLKSKAKEMLFKITKKEDLRFAKKARELMLKSMEKRKKRTDLYEKYKKELVNSKKDDRLDPSVAIEIGYLYFSRLMKSQKGDISLALASYNAGLQRVRKYKGIPPFDETVVFRNRVLQYYYDYLDRISK